MPLTAKGAKIRKSMEKTYGSKKGKQVFYASKNAGKISGVDRQLVMDQWALVEQAFFDGTFDAPSMPAKPKKMTRVSVSPAKIGHRMADIGPGGKEYNVKTGGAWTAAHEAAYQKNKKLGRDAPTSLTRRYHPITAVGGFPYETRKENRAVQRGQEAKIASKVDKALNKYVPRIQRSEQMAQTRNQQGMSVRSGYHNWRAGRNAKKAINAINRAGFKGGGTVSPQSGQNVLSWALNKPRPYGPTPANNER